jgi:hypothetical protein
MTLRRVPSRWFVLPLLAVLIVPQGLFAQQPDKLAALTQSLAANATLQKQYKWVETTVISMKGEEKSRIQKQCFYGPDGKVQKQQLSAPPEPAEAPGGMKGKIAEKKKAEITAAMKEAAALVQSYVPPDPQRIQAVKTAGGLSISPTGPNSTRLDLRSYVKKGDTLSLGVDTALNALLTVSVQSYLESEKDAVTLDVTFARLRDGLSYPGNVVLNVPGQKIQVVIQNSGHQRVTPAAPAAAPTGAAKPAAAPAKPSASEAALDTLTGPIALYPDALVAQVLEGSKDVAAVQKFAGWLKTNSALKGTELQDAAQKAGFAAPYIALAPFPQVVQMMVEKPDWTRQLGAAFTSDEQAVYQSIQRLRAAAMALGNLKTTPQQEVVTEASSTGQTIILVQPANPQVVYVPVYNTQVVYVQPAPPPPPPSSANVAGAALVGFTVGIIIGASSNHYYYGPYAWHGGGAAYHYAYERREDYVDHRQDVYNDRQDYRQDNAPQRQQTAQANQDQRQSTAQANQSQRQTTAQSTSQANQAERQSTAQANQSQRQSTAQSTSQANQAERQSAAQAKQAERPTAPTTGGGQTPSQGQRPTAGTAPGTGSGQTASQRQSTAQASQAERQSTAQGNQASRQSTAQSSRAAGSGGGYQSGGAAKAQSARGSSSRASSRSGGSSRRR